MERYTGTAVRGDGRGRKIGFPTANLVLENNLSPIPEGIYACLAHLGEKTHKAVLHAGPRPTFPGSAATVELHILHYPDQDLYGEVISFTLVKRLRDIEKFDTIDALIEAIAEDCRQADITLNHSS